jgi:hypothetical protein
VAGPWFTVHESGDGWRELATIWLSNGERDLKARVEIFIELEEAL